MSYNFDKVNWILIIISIEIFMKIVYEKEDNSRHVYSKKCPTTVQRQVSPQMREP